MTLNAMMYSYVHEEEEDMKWESLNDFHNDGDPLKEQPDVNYTINSRKSILYRM